MARASLHGHTLSASNVAGDLWRRRLADVDSSANGIEFGLTSDVSYDGVFLRQIEMDCVDLRDVLTPGC